MTIQSLGYVGVRSTSLDDWSTYGTKLLGLQRVDKSRSSTAFRMDDRKQRIVVNEDGGEGIAFFGWEVTDAAGLDTFAGRLDAADVRVSRGDRALADERHVADLIAFNDPMGNRIELFHGAATASDPFQPGRSISGFRTGPLGIGHAVFNAATGEAVRDMMAFYSDILGFHLTDYYSHPFEARFLHVNGRHHSLAFVQTGQNSFHHLMMELFSFDDVGQAYDIAGCEEGRIATTLGRHTSDFMTSFYAWTPSRFMVEYGWGGRSIDPATWQAGERNVGPSLWGHDRAAMPEEVNKKALAMRLANGEKGLRAPVQVMEGNYQVMPGVCPWWDSVKNT